jgi:hypothetical protein
MANPGPFRACYGRCWLDDVHACGQADISGSLVTTFHLKVGNMKVMFYLIDLCICAISYRLQSFSIDTVADLHM